MVSSSAADRLIFLPPFTWNSFFNLRFLNFLFIFYPLPLLLSANIYRQFFCFHVLLRIGNFIFCSLATSQTRSKASFALSFLLSSPSSSFFILFFFFFVCWQRSVSTWLRWNFLLKGERRCIGLNEWEECKWTNSIFYP